MVGRLWMAGIWGPVAVLRRRHRSSASAPADSDSPHVDARTYSEDGACGSGGTPPAELFDPPATVDSPALLRRRDTLGRLSGLTRSALASGVSPSPRPSVLERAGALPRVK